MKNKTHATLFYDDTCRMCRGGVKKLGFLLKQAHVEIEPFENGAAEPEMKLRRKDGRVLGGVDVIFFLLRKVWWAAPAGWLGMLPPVHWVANKLYEKVAANRHCIGTGGACRI